MPKQLTNEQISLHNDIVASDLPFSEVIDTLSKRVLETETATENYLWTLGKYFDKHLVFDGLKDFNYSELLTTGSNSPFADTVIADFNGETNKLIRETAEAVTQSDVKTKILDEILKNFKTNPQDMFAAVLSNTENIEKSQGLVLEKSKWDRVNTTKFTIDTEVIALDDPTADLAVSRTIFKFLDEAPTTSKTKPYIGAAGVITINSNSVQPSLRFDSKDFILIKKPSYNTNIVFDGERSFFNWDGSQKELHAVETLDLTIYEGIGETERTALQDFEAFLIHKNAFDTILDWQGVKLVNAPKLYQIIHNFMKFTTYKRRDKPIIAFSKSVAARTPSKSNK